jgi:hypothetical protein
MALPTHRASSAAVDERVIDSKEVGVLVVGVVDDPAWTSCGMGMVAALKMSLAEHMSIIFFSSCARPSSDFGK